MSEPNESESLAVVSRELPPPATAETLIAQAIEKGVSVDTMERLMAMRRELRAENAKEAFDRAMSAFQSDCPTILKTKDVLNKDGQTVRYSYAPLDAIVSQVKRALKENGFGYRIVPEVTANEVAATCVVTHELGHSESASFRVPIDKDSYMNLPQKFASALTFAKRYAFCAAFGIMTSDEDDDGRKAGTSPEEDNQKARWAKSSSSSSTPAGSLHALKAKLWVLLKQAGKFTVAEAAVFLEKKKIVPPGKALSELTEAELRDAISKIQIIIEEAKQ